MSPITQWLQRLRCGEEAARSELFGAAYEDLRRLARARLRDGGRGTLLETTALVHETFLRFQHAGALRAEDQRAFFAYAAGVMRSVILNAVRERQALRRGGGAPRLRLDTGVATPLPGDEQTIVRLHDALLALEHVDERLARVVEMRYFGGFSETEIATALGLTERTVRRDWEKARLILAKALR
jgi:RNA polymerase sigma factor (TIGR02999 family)